jgi:hypothetical protein
MAWTSPTHRWRFDELGKAWLPWPKIEVVIDGDQVPAVRDDTLEGNKGADSLNAVDSPAGPDTLNGGPDTDACFSDAGDTPPSLTGGDC